MEEGDKKTFRVLWLHSRRQKKLKNSFAPEPRTTPSCHMVALCRFGLCVLASWADCLPFLGQHLRRYCRRLDSSTGLSSVMARRPLRRTGLPPLFADGKGLQPRPLPAVCCLVHRSALPGDPSFFALPGAAWLCSQLRLEARKPLPFCASLRMFPDKLVDVREEVSAKAAAWCCSKSKSSKNTWLQVGVVNRPSNSLSASNEGGVNIHDDIQGLESTCAAACSCMKLSFHAWLIWPKD